MKGRKNQMWGNAVLQAAIILTGSQAVWAAGVEGFLTKIGSTLGTVIGVPVFIIGVIVVGYSLITGNENAVKKGAYVLAGGAVILLAEPLVKMVQSLAK